MARTEWPSAARPRARSVRSWLVAAESGEKNWFRRRIRTGRVILYGFTKVRRFGDLCLLRALRLGSRESPELCYMSLQRSGNQSSPVLLFVPIGQALQVHPVSSAGSWQDSR